MQLVELILNHKSITKDGSVSNVAISENNQFVSAVYQNGTINIFNITKKEVSQIFKSKNICDSSSMQFINNRQLIVGRQDSQIGYHNNRIELFNFKRKIKTFYIHRQSIEAILNANKNLNIAASFDSTISLLDVLLNKF